LINELMNSLLLYILNTRVTQYSCSEVNVINILDNNNPLKSYFTQILINN
jgi:hypothetical protein